MPQLPERPDKKASVKKQRHQIEDLLRFVGGDPEQRNCQLFTDFLMPDDQEFGTSLTDGGSEVVRVKIEMYDCRIVDEKWILCCFGKVA